MIVKKLQLAAVLLSMVGYAWAGTNSIGTASARGDMRVDNYRVSGDATLFDGSVVETDKATADLRLGKGVEILLGAKSSGTLFSDHLLLQSGRSEVSSSNSFQVRTNAFQVTPLSGNSKGVVEVGKGNTVQVAALSGSFGVKDSRGALLARVYPGQQLAFAMRDGAPSAGAASQSGGVSFSGTGTLSQDSSGNYFLNVNGVKYQLTDPNSTCNSLSTMVGQSINVTGTTTSATPAGGATTVVALASCAQNSQNWPESATVDGILIGVGLAAFAIMAIINADKASVSP